MDIKEFEDLCEKDVTNLNDATKFERDLILFSHHLDEVTENLIDKNMCTEVCPCIAYPEAQ